MNGRKIVILMVAGAAAFALTMMWWARAVGFPGHPAGAVVQGAAAGMGAKTGTTTSAVTAANANPKSAGAAGKSGAPPSTADKQAQMLQAVLAIQKANSERYERATARWGKETRDAAWAKARENALRLALESDNIEITPDQLECRATLCRLTLHLPNPLPNAHAMRNEISASTAVGNEGSGANRVMILFIPRAGRSLDS